MECYHFMLCVTYDAHVVVAMRSYITDMTALISLPAYKEPDLMKTHLFIIYSTILVIISTYFDATIGADIDTDIEIDGSLRVLAGYDRGSLFCHYIHCSTTV